MLEAGSRDDFRHEVVRFSQNLGFNTVSAMAVVDYAVGRSEFVSIDNAPDGYAAAMHDVPAMRRDPVMQHCRHQSVPIIWDQSTYIARGAIDLWEHQSHFGFNTGIAMALHLPEGRHFLLGVDRAVIAEDVRFARRSTAEGRGTAPTMTTMADFRCQI